MVHFHHEEPQGSQHSADISASPINADWIEGRQYTKFDAILVIEGKRLPTPGSGRHREYVSSETSDPPMGGVQRFKLSLHGAMNPIAAIIGYIQSENCAHWFAEVNRWIDELASSDKAHWSRSDRLNRFVHNTVARISRCESKHSRPSAVSPRVRLAHLWIEMSVHRAQR